MEKKIEAGRKALQHARDVLQKAVNRLDWGLRRYDKAVEEGGYILPEDVLRWAVTDITSATVFCRTTDLIEASRAIANARARKERNSD